MKNFIQFMAPATDAGDPDELIITLAFEDEDGKEVAIETRAIGVFDVEGEGDFIALEDTENEGDILIYAYKEISSGDEEVEFEIAEIESEELFEKAVDRFDEIMSEEE